MIRSASRSIEPKANPKQVSLFFNVKDTTHFCSLNLYFSSVIFKCIVESRCNEFGLLADSTKSQEKVYTRSTKLHRWLWSSPNQARLFVVLNCKFNVNMYCLNNDIEFRIRLLQLNSLKEYNLHSDGYFLEMCLVSNTVFAHTWMQIGSTMILPCEYVQHCNCSLLSLYLLTVDSQHMLVQFVFLYSDLCLYLYSRHPGIVLCLECWCCKYWGSYYFRRCWNQALASTVEFSHSSRPRILFQPRRGINKIPDGKENLRFR